MANADVAVDWQVSATDTFATLVAGGTVTTHYADAHSVHVVAGGLSPDAEYYYRFRAQGFISPVGRTRTAPVTGTFGRDLTMAFASCSHYESGCFTAYRRMVEDRPERFRPAGVLRPAVRRVRRGQHGCLGRLPRLPVAHPAGLGGPLPSTRRIVHHLVHGQLRRDRGPGRERVLQHPVPGAVADRHDPRVGAGQTPTAPATRSGRGSPSARTGPRAAPPRSRSRSSGRTFRPPR
jgi:hypothetical protein